jgi:hypothetical protein
MVRVKSPAFLLTANFSHRRVILLGQHLACERFPVHVVRVFRYGPALGLLVLLEEFLDSFSLNLPMLFLWHKTNGFIQCSVMHDPAVLHQRKYVRLEPAGMLSEQVHPLHLKGIS